MRITKDMADRVAHIIRDKRYSKLISARKAKFDAWANEMCEKYIPASFKESCLKETTDRVRMDISNNVCFTREDNSSYSMCIYATIENGYVGDNIYVRLTEKEWDFGKKLENCYNEFSRKSRDFGAQLSITLYELRTTKKVKDLFPEALPYFPSEETVSLPSVVPAELRRIVKDLK